MRRSLPLVVLCFAFVLSACHSAMPEERWSGESIVKDVSNDLELAVTTRRPGIVYGHYVVGAVRGTFDGTVAGEALAAELRPSDACTYALSGTMSDTLLEAAFAPSGCPGGQSGTWRLERR